MRLFTLVLAILVPTLLWAENFKVVDLTGAPKFRAPKQFEAKVIQKGDELAPGGRVKMEASDTINLVTSMGDKIALTGKSYVLLSELSKDASGKTSCKVEMFEGVINSKVHKLEPESVYQVRSPAAVAGVRGTEFTMEVKPTGETTVECTEGQVEVRVGGTEGVPVPVEAGKSATVKQDGSVVVSVAKNIQQNAENRAAGAGEKKEDKKEEKKEEKNGDKADSKSGENNSDSDDSPFEPNIGDPQEERDKKNGEIAAEAAAAAEAELQITIESINR